MKFLKQGGCLETPDEVAEPDMYALPGLPAPGGEEGGKENGAPGNSSTALVIPKESDPSKEDMNRTHAAQLSLAADIAREVGRCKLDPSLKATCF